MADMYTIDRTTAELIHGRAGTVFKPRQPIDSRDFFAGRWNQLTTVVDAVGQVGLHIVIYGERGVGKTSIANIIKPLMHVFDQDAATVMPDDRLVIKVNSYSEDTFSSLWNRAFDEIEWVNVAPAFGFSTQQDTEVSGIRGHLGLPGELTIDHVRRTLAKLPESVFVFDEFDRFPRIHRRAVTDLVKALQDYAVNTTIILVGVSETVDQLIGDHASIRRALIQVEMPRMEPNELRDILTKAETALEVEFDDEAAERIVRMSQGLPHYTHLVGRDSVRCACDDRTKRVRAEHVNKGFIRAVRDAYQSVQTDYRDATHSSHPDALYAHVLLACAISAYSANDDHGFFQAVNIVDPLSSILGRKGLKVWTFNKHLTEFCEDDNRGKVLERRGKQRMYRYRFTDPLMPPYVIMKGLASGMITEERLKELTGG